MLSGLDARAIDVGVVVAGVEGSSTQSVMRPTGRVHWLVRVSVL